MSFIYRIRLMLRFLFDKKIPAKEKMWIIIPAIYIISPIDLIPFPIFGFSLIDDLIVFMFTLGMVKEKTRKYYGDEFEQKEQKEKSKNDFSKKDIIEGVEYKVDDQED